MQQPVGKDFNRSGLECFSDSRGKPQVRDDFSFQSFHVKLQHHHFQIVDRLMLLHVLMHEQRCGCLSLHVSRITISKATPSESEALLNMDQFIESAIRTCFPQDHVVGARLSDSARTPKAS